MMPRPPTPDILAVSQETPPIDAVAVAMQGGPAPAPMHGSTVHWVWLSHVLPNPYQTRMSEDPEHIIGLARSIRAERANLPDTAGLQQVPLGRLVWRLSNGDTDPMQPADHAPHAVASLLQDGAHVQLAFGHSRFAAFELLASGLGKRFPNYDNSAAAMHVRAEFLEGDPAYSRIPVRIVYLDDTAMWTQAVRENHERKDLTPLEEARAMNMAISALGLTTEQAGKAFGYERSTAANKLRLLNLPQTALDLIQTGWMTERHGRELLRLAPAPHLQAAVIADLVAQRQGCSDVEVETVANMASRITRLIEQQTAMPAEEIKAARTGYSMELTHKPPAWPLDWTSSSPDVVGPCLNCQYRVVFGSETFPRCTKTQCYTAKHRIWSEKEKERQRAAALAAVEAARPAQPVHVERVIDRIVPANYSINIFGQPSVPAALLEHGLCGQQQCDCFCLARLDEWRRNKEDSYVRPDAANAPDIVYACNSGHNLAARKRRLAAILEPEETQAENQRRAALAAQTKQSKDLLRQFYTEIGAAGLASSPTVMAKLLGRNSYTTAKEDVAEIWEQIFWLVAESAGKVSEWRDYERFERWDLAQTQSWIQKVRSEIAPVQSVQST
jgi:ParB-like chromosome segregation protein Spo0J